MPFTLTALPGVLVYEPKVFEDSRGYFFEAYNESVFQQGGLSYRFVQDNQSRSTYGVVRGLHYQLTPHAQTKLVRVLEGAIVDVAVDIRQGSPTYGQAVAVELSADNKKQLLVPAGFAHGFSVISPIAVVLYKCDAVYNREAEGGIRYDDPALAIDWRLPADEVLVSEKDQQLPTLAECRNNFHYQP